LPECNIPHDNQLDEPLALVYFSFQNPSAGKPRGKKSCFWHFRSLGDTHPSSTFPLYAAAMKMVKIRKSEINQEQP
jgi:hypothetical protein